jgi:uncharacterized protein (TIGR02996 family)
MQTRDAFLADICARPDDDAPRLIFADWLDEHGDAADRARAELIRVQCRLAALPDEHRERPPLEERSRELLALHEAGWRAQLPSLPGVRWGDWERGFVGDATVAHAKAFREQADALFAAAPIQGLAFLMRVTARTVAEVMASPYLARLTYLSLYNNPIGDAGAAAVAASPRLTNLANLSLGCCGLHDAAAEALAAAPHLRPRILGLFDNAIGPAGARALASSSFLEGAVELALQQNVLGDDGAKALAASRHLGALRSLSVSYNEIGDEGARALALSPLLGLTDLYLVGNRIGDAGAAALAASPNLGELKTLHLGGNRIGPAGARALAAATGLDGLVELTIYDYEFHIDREGEALLRRRFGERVDFAERPRRR